MDGTKLLIIMIAFILAGLIFFAIGLVFCSDSYLQKLSDSRENMEEREKLRKTGRLCGSISMGTGGFTIFCGILAKVFPPVFHVMALIYVVLLIAVFCVISFSFSKK